MTDPDTYVQPVTWLSPQRPVEGGTVHVRPDQPDDDEA